MSLTITGWTLDAPSYSPGTPVNLTVNFSSTDVVAAGEVSDALTVALTDTAGTVSQAGDNSPAFPDLVVNGTPDTPQPVTGTVTDTANHTWLAGAVTFAPGTTAPFTGTALFSTVA